MIREIAIMSFALFALRCGNRINIAKLHQFKLKISKVKFNLKCNNRIIGKRKKDHVVYYFDFAIQAI